MKVEYNRYTKSRNIFSFHLILYRKMCWYPLKYFLILLFDISSFCINITMFIFVWMRRVFRNTPCSPYCKGSFPFFFLQPSCTTASSITSGWCHVLLINFQAENFFSLLFSPLPNASSVYSIPIAFTL